TVPVSVAVGWILLEDLDGDGKLDICATAFDEPTQICLFRNVSSPGKLGTSSFAAQVDLNRDGLFAANRLSAGDLDGDGRLDLVLPPQRREIRIVQNVGRPGALDSTTFRFALNVGVPGSASFVRDLDGDGRLDFAVFSLFAPGVQIL